MNNEEKILGILETLTIDITGMKADMTEMKGRLDKVEAIIDETNKDVRKIRQAVTVLEHDHKKMTEALMDGFISNTEKLTRIEDKVTFHDKILIGSVS